MGTILEEWNETKRKQPTERSEKREREEESEFHGRSNVSKGLIYL